MCEEVFARITLDTIFKIVFTKAKNKGSLLFLLNTCLREVLREPITDVEIIQTVEPPDTGGGRFTVFDMQCKDAKGNRFIVEMQVGKQRYFIKRTFFCICRAVSNLVDKGKTEVEGREVPYDYNIPMVYTLSFLDFDMDFGEGCDEVVQYLSVSNDLHPEARYDLMRMVYVLLPRFVKNEWEECGDAFEQLVFAFRKAHTMKSKPAGFKDSALEDIFESAKISNLSKEELMDYERRMKYISDTAAAMEYAVEEGIQKFIALLRQGYSIEEAESKLKLARTQR
jgi:predicted transposase/invertase (TIGR01784 family)